MEYKDFYGSKYTRRKRRGVLITIVLGFLLGILAMMSLMFGSETITFPEVVASIIFKRPSDNQFILHTLRLPRMLAGLMSGMAFGFAGNTFQKMLRNPLASPDVIGITSGASISAVYGILVLGYSGMRISVMAMVMSLIVTLCIYLLSQGGSFSGGKLILIGIGVQAMIQSAISYLLLQASQYDVAYAMRWLSGSLNGMRMANLVWFPGVLLVFGGIVLLWENKLLIMELGEEKAITLGLSMRSTQGILILSAVCLLAFGTAITGPIAFVSFLSGPIAGKCTGKGVKNALASAFVGGILVLLADFMGQHAFDTRFPVGVMTGIIGAPYLLYLLIDLNKKGGAI